MLSLAPFSRAWKKSSHSPPHSLAPNLSPSSSEATSFFFLLYILLFSFLSDFDYIFKQTDRLSTSSTGACFAAIAAGSTAFTICAPGLFSLTRRKTEYSRRALDPRDVQITIILHWQIYAFAVILPYHDSPKMPSIVWYASHSPYQPPSANYLTIFSFPTSRILLSYFCSY